MAADADAAAVLHATPPLILSVCYCPESNRKVWRREKNDQRNQMRTFSLFIVNIKWQRPFKETAHKTKHTHTHTMKKAKTKRISRQSSRMNVSLRFTMRKSNFHFFLIGKCHDFVLPSFRYNLHCCKQKKLIALTNTHTNIKSYKCIHFFHIFRSNERALHCIASTQVHTYSPSRLDNIQQRCMCVYSKFQM